MRGQKRLYLDVCCLERPFDDQSQERIHLEAEAVMAILNRSQRLGWICVSSEVIFDEIEQNDDEIRRKNVALLAIETRYCRLLDAQVIRRAEALEAMGFDAYDALHLACAEKAKCDVLLTTDDRFLKRASANAKRLTVRVANPLEWWSMEVNLR